MYYPTIMFFGGRRHFGRGAALRGRPFWFSVLPRFAVNERERERPSSASRSIKRGFGREERLKVSNGAVGGKRLRTRNTSALTQLEGEIFHRPICGLALYGFLAESVPPSARHFHPSNSELRSVVGQAVMERQRDGGRAVVIALLLLLLLAVSPPSPSPQCQVH